jgi:DNA-binding response OmpR family regulator
MAINSSPNSHSGQRVLVVDDDPSIRLICTTSLKNAGYQVLEAEGSSEAMALFTAPTTAIDLLVTDLFLPPPDFQLSSSKNQYPRVNGHELVQQVLSLKKELRVLLMSSHTLSSLAAQGIMIKPDRFLHKPFSVEQLLTHVAAALTGPALHRDQSATAPAKDVQWVD